MEWRWRWGDVDAIIGIAVESGWMLSEGWVGVVVLRERMVGGWWWWMGMLCCAVLRCCCLHAESQPKAHRKDGRDRASTAGRRKLVPEGLRSSSSYKVYAPSAFFSFFFFFLQPRPPTQIIVFAARLSS